MKKAVTDNRSFRKQVVLVALAFCASYFGASAQPVISGENAVCAGSIYNYNTPYHAGSTWNWIVTSGGVIIQNNGNAIVVKWTGTPNSIQSLSVLETLGGGAVQAAQLTVFIKNGTLSCNNLVHVSLDNNGQAEITPNILLSGNYNTYEGYTVGIYNNQGINLGNVLNCSHIGLQLTGKVTDNCTGNSCWGQIKIEDKNAPVFTCPTATVEIPCDSDLENYPPPPVYDNCDVTPTLNLIGYWVNNSNACAGVSATKTWVAIDDYGNSSTCTQSLFINPNATIDFPDDRTWSCAEYNSNQQITDATPYTGVLATTGSGIPSGMTGLYCPYNYLHHDDTLAACGNTFKILRTWVVVNWCTGVIVTQDINGDDAEQVIVIMDTQAPTLFVPPITLSATIMGNTPINCSSMGLLPAPTVSDECGFVNVQIFTNIGEALYLNGSNGLGGGTIPFPGLGIGVHIIKYKATDACGNVNELNIVATVIDDKSPTAVCDELTNVNLDATGHVEVFAGTFDDGSNDNCCIGDFMVKRMDEPFAPFDVSVHFGCDDDPTEMVVMRVSDCFGNHNECMVEVLVNDKISPLCIPPPQKIIPCTQLPADVTQQWLNQFGSAITTDNCDATIVELPYAENINACGEGHVIRFFAAVDNAGNIANCEQHIYVTPDSEWSIHFPADWFGACGSIVDAPAVFIDNAGCDMFAVNVEDQYFGLSNDSACYKIIRTWTVINWCLYNPYVAAVQVPHTPLGVWVDETSYNNAGKYTYQQIIKVHDDTPPVVSYPFANEFCVNGADCSTGPVFLPLLIDGECTDDFDIFHHLDLDSDGDYELNGQLFFEGTLPIGNHRILYLVADGCGNETTFILDFVVKDCKPPSPICENGLIVEIMQTGNITICASDFDYGSYDNCGGPVWLSFSQNVADSCRLFDCFDSYFQIPLQIWVTDEAGNQDFCTTFVTIQDNMFSCDTGLPIDGLIATAANDGVENVSVEINTPGGFSASTASNENGMFSFTDLDEGDYTLTPLKDDNPLNGVSTFDLVLIMQHILGTQSLTSPYRLIAADVNHSGTVTTFDLLELRKLLLFVEDDFPNNTSWRFVDKKHVFPNPANPWQTPFPEVISINNLTAEVTDADFVAIKVGDVNGNANPNEGFAGGSEERNGNLTFQIADREFSAGETILLQLTAKDFHEVSGFQFSLTFDQNMIDFQSVTLNGLLGLENVGLAKISESVLTVSWNEALPLSLADGSTVLELEFSAKTAGQLSGNLDINSRYTGAEAYVGEALDIRGIGLAFSAPQQELTGFQLLPNVPNPFSEATTISFRLPEAAPCTFTFFDETGRQLLVKNGEFGKGLNRMELKAEELSLKGIIFFRLETPGEVATGKMVVE